MPFILIIAIILSIFENSWLHENASKLSSIFHQSCLQQLPNNSQRDSYEALLCGKNITDSELRTPLTKTSLIHLYVVSGSHLILLEKIFLFLRVPEALRMIGIFFYALTCNWQAPVVRAALHIGLRRAERTRGALWPTDIMILLTGILGVLLFPDWLASRSFLMSWGAALALTSTSLWKIKLWWPQMFCQGLSIYLIMLPFLWSFGNLHPLAILYNLLLAPVVTLWLFPLAALSAFYHPLIPWLEKSQTIFLKSLALFSDPVTQDNSAPASIVWLWILIFVLHFLFHLLRVHYRRRSL